MKKTKKVLGLSVLFTAMTSLNVMAQANLSEGFDHSHRSEKNVVRDEYRKPFETLSFFGVKENNKVVEILPGGGWYTEILAPMLKDKGELVAVHYPHSTPSKYRKRSRENFDKKLADNKGVYGNVVVADFMANGDVDKKAKNADFVLTFRGLHGLQNGNGLASAFVQFNEMLKEGGKLGVVQHQAPDDFNVNAASGKGYLPKPYIVAVANAAGFDLVAESHMHHNAKDRILIDGAEAGVWSLPPSLNVKTEEEKTKYKKVGESNRMTLLFKKR